MSAPVTLSNPGSGGAEQTAPVAGGAYELKLNEWGGCIANNGAPFPVAVSMLKPGQLTTGATCSTTGVTGEWDNAYDIWLASDPNPWRGRVCGTPPCGGLRPSPAWR